jgi:hypothetical protein
LFEHPSEVVSDPDLTLNEKRAILAAWASDACAIEAVPTLRRLPGGKRPVHFDEVMDALRALDEEPRRSPFRQKPRAMAGVFFYAVPSTHWACHATADSESQRGPRN